jgi:hypothetical protein
VTYSRRVKRLRAGWDGLCRIEGDPEERRCRVDDISMLGAGVTFAHPAPTELAGRRISVDVPAVAQLEGEITHAEVILGGAVRVGIVFKDGATPEHDGTTSRTTLGNRT